MIWHKSALFAVMVAVLAFSNSALAQTAPGPGLGARWPAAQDVSVNPSYHVYRWVQGGVKYLQVNDLAGNVKFAVGQVGNQVFVLPIGSPNAVQVSELTSGATMSAVPMESSPDNASDASVIYSDSTISVQQTPTAYAVHAAAICKDPVDCSG